MTDDCLAYDPKRLPEFPLPDSPEEPTLDFGPAYRKPYVSHCRYCGCVHMSQVDYIKCQSTSTDGW